MMDLYLKAGTEGWYQMHKWLKRIFSRGNADSLDLAISRLKSAKPGEVVILPDGFTFTPLCRCNHPDDTIEDQQDPSDLDRVT